MTQRDSGRSPDDLQVDAEIDYRLIEVKAGVAALRSVRVGLMKLAYLVAARPGAEGFLVLPDVAVTRERLQREWELAATILQPEVLDRLSLCIGDEDHLIGIPREPDVETQRLLARVIAEKRSAIGSTQPRGKASFVVLKILLHHWLMNGTPVTTDWLAATSGYSYPTIASVLHNLGSLVERQSDRRLRLRWFSREEFARLLGASDRARDTVRFADRSGQPRSPEVHVRRLEKLDPADVGLGGVLGAKHYFQGLDIVGIPRLDLSRHCPRRDLDLGFIGELDPALRRVEDPLEPATVVVHAIRHADSLFATRKGGLHWADPVECLLDLHEAHLDLQASGFLDALQRSRPSGT